MLKKPLRRIEIEEIDNTDIKRKISDMSADTRAYQSSEKKKMEARDSEMFSKFTSSPASSMSGTQKQTKSPATTQSPDIGQTVTAAENKTPPKIETSSAATTTVEKSSASRLKTSSPRGSTSPRSATSPRAPTNSFQFQKDWKEMKSDLKSAYEYLKVS